MNDHGTSFSKSFADGRSLLKSEASELELFLKTNPNSVADRLKLIAFYNKQTPHISSSHFEHYFWLIDNQPFCNFWREPIEMGYLKPCAPKLFGLAREKWQNSISKIPNDVQVVGNAGLFIVSRDIELGDALLNQAANADPSEEIWLAQSCEANYWQVQYGLHLYQEFYARKSLIMGKRFLNTYGDAGGRRTAGYRVRKILVCARNAFIIGELSESEAFCREYIEVVKAWTGPVPKFATSLMGLVALRRNNVNLAIRTLLLLDSNMRINQWDLELAEGLIQRGYEKQVLDYVHICSELGHWPDQDLVSWFQTISKKHHRKLKQ